MIPTSTTTSTSTTTTASTNTSTNASNYFNCQYYYFYSTISLYTHHAYLCQLLLEKEFFAFEKEVVIAERVLLNSLNFDLNVKHPHNSFKEIVKELKCNYESNR